MPVNDALGTRMKTFYEAIPKTYLMRRTPVAIRIDGKAFHTFTRGFQKPFDEVLGNAMVRTMEHLCRNIQGCVFGYTQSDEITLLLVDYKNLNSSAWFDYQVQKMCSISASMATLAFNKYFAEEVSRWHIKQDSSDPDIQKLWGLYVEKAHSFGAMFDARVFNIPKDEATNLVYWRQVDATRNSIQMAGRAYFSHSALDEKSCSDIQDMLHEHYDINWNNYPTRWKRGVACYRRWDAATGENQGNWYVDYDMPILRGEDRSYVDRLIYGEEVN